jgi:predicted DsbA family dithiol-disulfide isomerase
VVDEVARRFDAHVQWLPFDLHPEYPPEGIPRSDLERRYGRGIDEHTRRFFEHHGLEFNPPDVIPNSFDALRLTELARDRDLHEPFHDRLMEAHWAEAQNVGDHDVLRALAAEVGLPADAVEETLAGDDYAERVRASTREAQSVGITGIPAFVLDGRVLVLGAQPVDVFRRAFTQLEGGTAASE